MAVVFRLILTFISISLAFIVFLIKEEMYILRVSEYSSCIPEYFSFILSFYFSFILSFIIYFIICLFFTWLSLKLMSKLPTEGPIKKNSIKSIEIANDAFLPSYIGYFFVALSIPDIVTFIIVFILLGILIYFSQVSYFNPLYILLGYNFYYATTKHGAKNLIISKRVIKIPKGISFEKVKRINNFTFIDLNEK